MRARRGFRQVVLPLLPILVIAVSCGGDATASTAAPPEPAATVSAGPSLNFSPKTVAIVAGGSVTFDFGAVAHNVYFDGQPPGAPANITGLNENTSKKLIFSTPGTYVYNCHIHPGMQGTVVVSN